MAKAQNTEREATTRDIVRQIKRNAKAINTLADGKSPAMKAAVTELKAETEKLKKAALTLLEQELNDAIKGKSSE